MPDSLVPLIPALVLPAPLIPDPANDLLTDLENQLHFLSLEFLHFRYDLNMLQLSIGQQNQEIFLPVFLPRLQLLRQPERLIVDRSTASPN